MANRFMTRISAIGFSICALQFSLSAQTNLLTQGFEALPFPPSGWSNVRMTGPTLPGTWSRLTNGLYPVQTPHTGSYQMRYNSHNFLAGTSGEMRTSVLDFTTLGTYTVSFWMYRDNWVAADKLEVFVNTLQTSVGGTLLGTINRNRSQSPVEPANGWYQYTFTVPGTFNTATNYIIFKATSAFGNDIHVDDISVDRLAPAAPGCITSFTPVSGTTGVCVNETLAWDIVALASGYKITLGNNAPDYNNVAAGLDLGVALGYSDFLDASTTYNWQVTPYNAFGEATGCPFNNFTTGTGTCYCTPVYLDGSCGSEDFIDDFSTSGGATNISNNNSGCSTNPNNYTFFAAQTVTAQQGNAFSVSMQSGTEFAEGFAVWVDWNIDGDFADPGEYAFNSGIATLAVVTGSITVPYTAVPGTTRMRVRCAYNYVPAAETYCTTFSEGETEDYTMVVTPCPATIYYADADGDTYGDATSVIYSCTGAPAGYTTNTTDCNDALSTVYPGAPETCNTIDDDCDALIDEGLPLNTYYADGDGDGYGNAGITTAVCGAAPAGFVANSTDCNDANAAIKPGGVEICNAIDDDCDVNIDEGVIIATITAAGPTTFCNGSTVTLQANTGAGYTYQWMRNGGNIGGATGASYTTNKGGNYQVRVTVPGGCFNISAATAITVLPMPAANITAVIGTDLCGFDSLTLRANNGTGYTWQWMKGASNIAGATSRFYYPATTGNYRVKVTNPSGCTKTSASTTIVKTCREEMVMSKSQMQLYPNPAADRVEVYAEGMGLSGSVATILIYDAVGKVVLTVNADVFEGLVNTSLNISALPAGMYVVQLVSGDMQDTKRLVISK